MTITFVEQSCVLKKYPVQMPEVAGDWRWVPAHFENRVFD